MNYKTLLVHADLGPDAPARIRLACRLARTFDAHLIGSAVTGVSRFIPPRVIAEGGQALIECCSAMRRHADEALEQFSRIVIEENVVSSEARLVDDDIDGGMAVQARYSDLTIVGQVDRDATAAQAFADLPGYLLLNSGRPVLVVPSAECRYDLQEECLVAWDGSVEATRAVAGALPLLRRASAVTALTVGDTRSWAGADEDPCVDMVAYLKRHGVAAHGRRCSARSAVAEELLCEAARSRAGLLVMGGYGQTRFREMLLGGVTATILRSMTLPVLLAH